jgi:NAD(P)H-hydrate epimerase
LPEAQAVAVTVATVETARALLPPRPADGHKGTFGTALVVAGSGRYWGAPALAARAAYRAGAGLVAVAVPANIRPTIAGQLPEATYPPVGDADMFSAASVPALRETIGRSKALLVGPGLGEAKEFLPALLTTGQEETGQPWPPLVVDADGLNLLAALPAWPQRLPANTTLTPHPGEMARLMNLSLADIQAQDRVNMARRQAAAWGHVVVLKGAYTVVAAPDGRCAILPFANPALATAGSGDVLAGIIVGLLAQGMAAYEAAVLGGYLHGAAGALYPGKAGLLAGEIADLIPRVIEGVKG